MNKLRFTGHTEPWEQKKLEDVTAIDGGYAFQSKDYTEHGARVIRISDVQSGFISDKDSKFVNSSLMSSKLDNYELLNNDIVMSLTGIVGRVARIKENHTPCYLNQRVARVNTLNNSDNKFIYSLLNNSSFEQVALKNATGGAQKNMKTSWLNNYKIPLPSLPEQEKIGGFLSALDERLRVQSELVDLLALEYTGYSQRIFNQTLRFKDEDGNNYPDWEQKKLGEVADFHMGFTPSTKKEEYWSGNNHWLNVKGLGKTKYIQQGNKMISDEAIRGKKVFEPGTLLMSFKLSLGELGITQIPLFTNEAICGFMPKPVLNTEYLYYVLDNTNLKNYAQRAVMGYTMNNSSIKTIDIPLPSLPEQVKIGGFLSALSARIETERALLAQYKEQKKAYLQKLLP